MILTQDGELYVCGQLLKGEIYLSTFTQVAIPGKKVHFVDFILESSCIIVLDSAGNVYRMRNILGEPEFIATEIIQISSGFLFLNKNFQIESPPT